MPGRFSLVDVEEQEGGMSWNPFGVSTFSTANEAFAALEEVAVPSTYAADRDFLSPLALWYRNTRGTVVIAHGDVF